MSVLHGYFHLRKQQEFQRCLEQAKSATSTSNFGQLSTSGGSGPSSKSWKQNSGSLQTSLDVNARDWMGRTVLHLACAALDPAALEFARLLLAHPNINVNVQDQESLWSPLHRALYAGNIQAAVLLAQRDDIDLYIKDAEGYTPFDLYNSTVPGTNPTLSFDDNSPTDLYVWGSNRNATLGLGDDNDRITPEQVLIRRENERRTNVIVERLRPVPIRDISMSRLHTTIVTAEKTSNLRACGFASDGRLGPSSGGVHAQFSLINPQRALSHIVKIASAQDHTLVVNTTGEVLSWGLNRFSQLGYVIEGSIRTLEAQVQISARKITGALRNQVVIGVACCKTASACWTARQLYTWGTNNGQLGYEKTAQPQILPRLVPSVNEPVLAVAMTDSAMLVLLASKDVICIHDGSHWRLPFTNQRRSSRSLTKERVEIRKVIACEGSVGSFALVSEAGDVYLFNVEDGAFSRKETGKDGGTRRPIPQLVWAVRRHFLGVKDAALGADGSMILCTTSGHVFIRSRITRSTVTAPPGTSSKNTPPFKFLRIPNLQRVTKVYANSTGAFAALRNDAVPNPILPGPYDIADDLARVQPVQSFLQAILACGLTNTRNALSDEMLEQSMSSLNAHDEDETDDSDIVRDIRSALQLYHFSASALGKDPFEGRPSRLAVHHGADIVFRIGDVSIPLHYAIIDARLPALRPVLSCQRLQFEKTPSSMAPFIFAGKKRQKWPKCQCITVEGCSIMTLLLLCQYLYTDRLPAIWDRRVSSAIRVHFPDSKIDPWSVRDELQLLASSKCLHLPSLETASQAAGKCTISRSLPSDLYGLFQRAQTEDDAHDVVLILGDARVKAHSIILRARSPFFATFFDEECWTLERSSKGLIEVDLHQFNARPMSYLLRYLYGHSSPSVFEDIDFVSSTEQLIEFMFEVIACSNHLLVDRFTDICSFLLLQSIDLSNATYILAEAQHYNAATLVNRLHGYMARNLETLIGMGALDELSQRVLKSFSTFVRQTQRDFHPYIRKGGNISTLEQKWASWLAQQDIPAPFVPRYLTTGLRSLGASIPRDMSRLSPEHKKSLEHAASSPPGHLTIVSSKREVSVADDELFPMDTDPSTDTVQQPRAIASSSMALSSGVWRSVSVSQKMDMKSIMEAEQLAADSSRRPRQTTAQNRHLIPAWKIKSVKEVEAQHGTSLNHLPKETLSQKSIQNEHESPSMPPAISVASKQIDTVAELSPSKAPPWKNAMIAPTAGSPTSVQLGSTDLVTSKVPTKRPLIKSELGPLIVPSKMKPTDLPLRRSSSGQGTAWANLAPQMAHTQSVSDKSMSFEAIQEQQAAKPVPRGPPRSLREIQEEEQEIAFLTWFEKESARIQQQEADMLMRTLSEQQPSRGSSRRGRKPASSKRSSRGERGSGRGRGKEVRVSTASVS